jgi:hypothetical protein
VIVGLIAFVLIRQSQQRRKRWQEFAVQNGYTWLSDFQPEIEQDLSHLGLFSGEQLHPMFNNLMSKRVEGGEVLAFDYTYQTGHRIERKLHEHTVLLFSSSWVGFDDYAADTEWLQVEGRGKHFLVYAPNYLSPDNLPEFIEAGLALFAKAVQASAR